jgi:hypothetical protein
MFGTAAQSNYMASNAFMDAFARYRRSLGLPATSLSLSQILGIGAATYMPEYHQAMLRNGLHGSDEDEFLQFCEAGISAVEADNFSQQYHSAALHDPHHLGHLLVGISPYGLSTVSNKYPLNEMVWSADPRFANLIQAISLVTSSAAASRCGGGDAGDEYHSVEDRLRNRISKLLYVGIEDVELDTSISSYGIDSMIAAELRN